MLSRWCGSGSGQGGDVPDGRHPQPPRLDETACWTCFTLGRV